MTALTQAQIELINKMGVERIQSDSDFFAGKNGIILGELITLNIVEKVRGIKGWSAWRVVNYYDLLDSGRLS